MASFTVLEDESPAADAIDGRARFTVIGVGGGGGNAVEHMIRSGVTGVSFVCANTDKQALDRISAPTKIQLGHASTRGLGAGANPEVGRLAATEEADELKQVLTDTDMVFITAGMGGGTGTGAAPVIAQMAREMDVLTVGVVTSPFRFEGGKRGRLAEQGIIELAEYVDSLIIIPNDKLLSIYADIPMRDAFRKVDDVLLNAVRSIFDLVVHPGYINIDFADVRTAMSARGYAMMGMGSARGEDRAMHATEQAIRSPLLDNIHLRNAQGLLVNITAAEDVTPREYQTITDVVNEIADFDNAEIFFGTVIDPDARDELRVTVIATGLERSTPAPVSRPLPSASTARPAGPTELPRAVNSPTGLDDDDTPALHRMRPDASPSNPAPPERPTSISIQDFLRNQQKR